MKFEFAMNSERATNFGFTLSLFGLSYLPIPLGLVYVFRFASIYFAFLVFLKN